MKQKFTKQQIKKELEDFFNKVKSKTPKEVKKIKVLAMSKNIPLKEKRKTFCKKCLAPYKAPKIRIKNKIKSVTCENCGYIARWKIK